MRRTAGSFAQVRGSPGEKPRLAGVARATWPLITIVAAAGYLLRAAWPVPALGKTVIGFLILLLCGVLAYSIVWSERRLGHFLKGARGEEQVARLLAFLPAAYRVYHGLTLDRGWSARGGDYDHIVVGPTGLFVVETKNWEGTIALEDGRILCDGEEPDRPPIEQVKEACSALRQRLATSVGMDVAPRPVVCFAGGHLPYGTTGAAGVVVCAASGLVGVIADSGEPPLAAEAQDRIAAFLNGLAPTE